MRNEIKGRAAEKIPAGALVTIDPADGYVRLLRGDPSLPAPVTPRQPTTSERVLLTELGVSLMRCVRHFGIKPDFTSGGEGRTYLRRWHIRPEGPEGGLYLHEIIEDDDDRALHDHPWDAAFYIIKGSYREITADNPAGTVYSEGCYRLHPAELAHRLVVVGGPVWTLAFLGPRRREWGFHCPQGWRHWKEFVSARDKGAIGKGCD